MRIDAQRRTLPRRIVPQRNEATADSKAAGPSDAAAGRGKPGGPWFPRNPGPPALSAPPRPDPVGGRR